MATRMAKALATTVVAAGLVAGIAFGGTTGAWESAQGGHGVSGGVTAGSRLEEDAFDPDPPADWRWTPDATPAVVAIDVVANYCSPTPCRPR